MISYAQVASPAAAPSVVSAMTQHSTPPVIAPLIASSSPSLHQVLSSIQSPAANPAPPSNPDSIVSVGGHFYRRVNATLIACNLSNHASTPVLSSLINGGTNGGMAGIDVRTVSKSFNKANVTMALVMAKFRTFLWPPLLASSLLTVVRPSSSFTSAPTVEKGTPSTPRHSSTPSVT
jgi:hypothetical protein